jgi:predicted HicB family RNase H-like nuclease
MSTHLARLETDPEHEKWLDEIVTLAEGAALRRTSVDTLKREHKRGNLEILELSPHRRGIRRREALKKS